MDTGITATLLLLMPEVRHRSSFSPVKSIRLVKCTRTHLRMIGEPTGTSGGIRFTRWTRLDESGTRVI
jgi:hypothetical protein